MIWRVSNCSHIQTPHIPKKVRIHFSPWLAPSLDPPACTPSLSLLLPSQSQTQWHPFTHPFMSHGQWVSGQRHTFQSDSCFSVSSGLDRGVCVCSASACKYCVFSCVFWVATAVLEIQGKLLEQIVELACFVPTFFLFEVSLVILSFVIWISVRMYRLWFRFCTPRKPVCEMWLEFSLVILDMFWLHQFPVTWSLSLFLCAKSRYRN